MPLPELILAYLDVMAWPAVVVVLALIFRRRLHELLGRVTEGEAFGIKAVFKHEVTSEADEPRPEATGLEGMKWPPTIPGTALENPGRTARRKVYPLSAERILFLSDDFEESEELTIFTSQMPDSIELAFWSWLSGFQSGRDDVEVTHRGGLGRRQKVVLRHKKPGDKGGDACNHHE